MTAPAAKATKEQPINPYEGTRDPITNNPDEMTEEQRADLAYQQRLFDEEGEDTAYELGLSSTILPAPKGGWPVSTKREELEI